MLKLAMPSQVWMVGAGDHSVDVMIDLRAIRF
jgi:hypothetical protein